MVKRFNWLPTVTLSMLIRVNTSRITPIAEKVNQNYLLTVRQAAKRLNLGINRTYGLANAGLLPCIKIGATIRIPAAALERWIEENTGKVL